MDILLIVLGAICLLVGLIGCVAPVLPGVPLAYLGLLLLHWTERVQFSWQFLTIWAVITIVIQVLDYVIPAWGTKRYGGTKYGVWGSTIGVFVGMFFGAIGIIVGPLVGAIVGELIGGKGQKEALRAGWGSFIGILCGTVLKLICCGWMMVILIQAIW